jgi:DNA-binding transcriptional ArsR family regulator
VTLILESADERHVSVRLSPLAELCACLHSISESKHHPGSLSWVLQARRRAGTALISEVERWAPLWGPYRARFLFPLNAGPGRPLAQELAEIRELPVREFVAMAAPALSERTSGLAFDRILDEDEARERFLHNSRPQTDAQRVLAKRLVAEPESFRTDFIAFVEDFATTLFDQEWAASHASLEQDRQRRIRDLRMRGPSAILGVSPTAVERENPRRLIFDKLYQATARLIDQGCILIPSVHVTPHLVIKHDPGRPVVIQYGVTPSGEHETAFEDVRRRILALNDPMRIRLCRALLREPRSTTDLARQTGMAESQVSRHLRRLREAGLVSTSRDGRLMLYQLDVECLERLGGDLIAAMLR